MNNKQLEAILYMIQAAGFRATGHISLASDTEDKAWAIFAELIEKEGHNHKSLSKP